MTFNETPPPSKTSLLVDDDLNEEEAIKVIEKKNLKNDIVDNTLEIDKIVNINESRNHPLENIIGNLNQRTLRNKLDENGIVSQNKATLVAQRYNKQEGIDYDETYASVAILESIRILLAYVCALDFKLFQMDVKSAFMNGFINEEDNDVTRLQALVDKKKVVATEAAIRELKRRVKKLEKGKRVRVLKLQRLKRVGTSQRIDTSDDTAMDDASNQGRIIDELDKDDVVALMDDKEEDKKDEEAKVVEDDQVQGRQAESQAKIYKINMDHASKVLTMQEDEPAEVQEVVDVVTTAKLITEVVTAASEIVTAASTTISTVEPQVPAATITTAPAKVAAAPSKRRKGVVIRDPEEELTTSSIIPADTKSKDKGKRIMVEEPKPLKKKQQVEMDEEYARKLHAELNKDINRDVAIDHVKLKAKEDPAIEEEESRALQRINETPAERATKRRKFNKEVEDLKRHLKIVHDEEDDVYTEATSLARKVHVVDYEIIEINNKPYYKIIRADGTHQLYISFLTLLKNFDREELEALWNLVKERFSTSKPKNFSDDFLLTTLEQCLRNQMDRLKSGKIKGLYMVKHRSRAGSY
nr:copia protein [Tanacetum cinerariifolium]